MTLLEYIKMHRGYDVCWDCPDKVFDAVITVDCSVSQDGKVNIIEDDKEYPNMPLFIKEFIGKVTVVTLQSDGTPIIDADGLFRRNITEVRQWAKKNWSVDLGTWDDDDIIYQLIQEIHLGIAGYKTNTGYGNYLKLLRSCDVEV